MKKRKTKVVVYGIILPLVVGAFLYFLLCPDVAFVKAINNLIGRSHYSTALHSESIIYSLFRNYFFDVLWAFSLAHALYLFIDNLAHAILWSVIGTTLLGAIMEILQLVGVAPGTFDPIDIAVECLGAILGAIIIKKYKEAL